MSRYDDIINMEHHRSLRRKPMAVSDRAAQFAPFAALTGYGDAIDETARLTDKKEELSDDQLQELNERLNLLSENKSGKPEITVIRFMSDYRKQGGAYVRLSGRFKEIDPSDQTLVLTNLTKIPLSDIFKIEGSIFGRDNDFI